MLVTSFRSPLRSRGRNACVTMCVLVTLVRNVSFRSSLHHINTGLDLFVVMQTSNLIEKAYIFSTPPGVTGMDPTLLINTSSPRLWSCCSTCRAASWTLVRLVASRGRNTTRPDEEETSSDKAGELSRRAVAKMEATWALGSEARWLTRARPRPREEPVTR